MIPSTVHDRILKQLGFIPWFASQESETKGSSLTEAQMSDVAGLLAKYDVIVEAVVVEMGDLTVDDIRSFQQAQHCTILDSAPDDADRSLRDRIEALAAASVTLSPQNFLQAYATIALIDKVVRTATAYHSQRNYRELGTWEWVIDAKDRSLTVAEQYWTTLLFPALLAKSSDDPVGYIPWGDYSRLPKRDPDPARSDGDAPIDMTRVMHQTRFASSSLERGLQLADYVASAITRALNQKLSPKGWKPFGRLLVYRNIASEIPEAVQFVAPRKSPDQPQRLRVQNFHGSVLDELRPLMKPMVPHWHRHHIEGVA